MAVAPRIPAWKRVGLELTNASDAQHLPPPPKKRRTDGPTEHGERQEPVVASSKNSTSADPIGRISEARRTTRPAKSVSFADAPAPTERANGLDSEEPDASKEAKLKRRREAREERRRQQQQHQQTDSSDRRDGPRPYLEYLRRHHEDRANWKFNKSVQTNLLRDCFNLFRVPAEFDEALHDYVSGLQGQNARIRLAEEAKKVLDEPEEQAQDQKSQDQQSKGQQSSQEKEPSQDQQQQQQPGEGLEGLQLERDSRTIKRRRAEKVLATMSSLMHATITAQREQKNQEQEAEAVASRTRKDGSAATLAARPKKSRGRKRRTADISSSSSSSSSSSESSSSESSDSDSD